MARDRYRYDHDMGAYVFGDNNGGEDLMVPGNLPAAQDHARLIDSQGNPWAIPPPDEEPIAQASPGPQMSSADGGMSAAPAPPPSMSDAGPRMNSASIMAGSGALNNAPPPPPPGGQSSGPMVSEPNMSQAPPMSMAGPPIPDAPQGPPQGRGAVDPGGLAFAGGGGDASPADRSRADAGAAWDEYARQQMRGTPGYKVKGGTFLTGFNVQKQVGPSAPSLTELEEAERRVLKSDQELAGVSAQAAENQEALREKEVVRAAVFQRQQERLQAQKAEKLGAIQQRIDEATEDFRSAKVDPHQFWGGKTAGERIGAAISIAFSGLGNALSGRPEAQNGALAIFNQAVDQNIDAQKTNIANKKGAISELGQVYQTAKDAFGSEEAGRLAAQIAGTEAMKAQIDMIAARANTKAAYLQADRAKAILDRDQAARRMQLDQAAQGAVSQNYQVTQDRVVGGTAANWKNAAEGFEHAAANRKGDEDGREHAVVNGERGTLTQGIKPEEAHEFRKFTAAYTAAKADLAHLRKERDSDPRNANMATATPKYTAQVNRVAATLSTSQGMGVLQGNEREEQQKLHSSLLAGTAVIEDDERFLDSLMNSKKDQLGFKPSPTAAPARPMPHEWVSDALQSAPAGGAGAAAAGSGKKGGPSLHLAQQIHSHVPTVKPIGPKK